MVYISVLFDLITFEKTSLNIIMKRRGLWHRMELDSGGEKKKKSPDALESFSFKENLIRRIFFLNPNTSLIKSLKSLVKWD